MFKSKKYLFFFIIIIALVFSGAFFLQSQYDEPAPVPLPPERAYNPAATLPVENTAPPTTADPAPPTTDPILPAEVNLKIPFTSQAPHLNWDLPYQQFCEEASILMAVSYLNNQSVLSPDDADAKMLSIKDFEVKKFGYYEDTTAEETVLILREYYKINKIETLNNPTVDDIKKALSQGRVVIVPLAGRELNNPHYQQPGPIYHMLVIKGYNKNNDFITNDPGTKHGADFIYKASTLMEAIHDWNAEDITAGKKVIIIVG